MVKKIVSIALVAFAGVCMVDGQPVKSSIGARTIASQGGSELTAKDYVQDGLVAMWDGIENAGWGVHDANATSWADLIGNSALTTEATSDLWEWTDNALWTKGCRFGAALTNTDYVNALRTTYTVEYVGEAFSLPITKYLWGMTSWASSAQRYAGLGRHIGSTYVVYCNGASNGAGLTDTGVVVGQDNKMQMSFVYKMEDGYCDVYKDSAYLVKAESASVADPSQMIPVIRIGGIGNDIAPSAKAHCVRLYSRALTAEEIAHNYAVDKQRFGLE